VQKGEVGPRSSRSKSLDVSSQKKLEELGDVNRNHRSPRAEQDVREFIHKKTNPEIESSKHLEHTSPRVLLGSMGSKDVGDMEAWELDIRIKMAEKQRQYTEISRKLKRLQSFKSKRSGRVLAQKKSPYKRLVEQKKKISHYYHKSAVELSAARREGSMELKNGNGEAAVAIETNSSTVKSEERPTGAKEEICRAVVKPDSDNMRKASSFTDTFHKFKKAYFAKKTTSTVVKEETTDKNASSISAKYSSTPPTVKAASFKPFSNWAKVVSTENPNGGVIKKEPRVIVKCEPVEEEEEEEENKSTMSGNSEQPLLPIIKVEAPPEEEIKNNSNGLEMAEKVISPQISPSSPRKKPKLEMFVVKSPKKKLGEEDNYRIHGAGKLPKEKKHSEEESIREKKTWKVVSTFNEREDTKTKSSPVDHHHHHHHEKKKKIDPVLTNSPIKPDFTLAPADKKEKFKKSDKKIKRKESQSDSEGSPIKCPRVEEEVGRVHKHKKDKKHKKDHHRERDDVDKEERRRRRKKEKKIKKELEEQMKLAVIKQEAEEIPIVKEEPMMMMATVKLETGTLRSCVLEDSDLEDGLRILKRVGPHFYPARVTEISPPDIYGVLIDGERGNKPHIASREEVLQEAVLDIRPATVSELPLGARVCAYWSKKISYLHPGTVAAPDIDSNYVIVNLDDGDSRDIHISDVRYLPANYPIVDKECDPIAYGGRRRSTTSSTSSPVKEVKKVRKPMERKIKTEQWSVSVSEVPSCSSTTPAPPPTTLPDLSKLPGPEMQQERDDDQDSAFVSNGAGGEDSDFEDGDHCPQRRISGSDKSKITAFLPPQHLLWTWADVGKKLSPKARKLHHQMVNKAEEGLAVGDCAVFLSTGRPDRPYIGRIQSMWESWTGNMKVQVKWFYHAAETEGTGQGGRRVEDIVTPGALFESSHYDENDIQTISHKCEVVGYKEKKERMKLGEGEEDQVYFLAGNYDPVVGSIVFSPGIFN